MSVCYTVCLSVTECVCLLQGMSVCLLQGSVQRMKAGCGKKFGMFLFFAYLFVKVLYIINAIGLIFVLDTMLGRSRLIPARYYLYLTAQR